MEIRPIRNEVDYRKALATVESLWDKAEPDTPDGDALDVLVTLVQAYEREHYPIPPPDPVEAIKFRVEQMGIGRKGLEGIIGTRARVAEVLSGTRALSIAMIRRLHRELGIPAEILIGEPSRPAPAKARPKGTRKTVATRKPGSARRAAVATPRTEKRVA